VTGRIIRIDTTSVRPAGRSSSGVKLLYLDPDDSVAAALVVPQKKPNPTRRGNAFVVIQMENMDECGNGV
jgi:DNA gyrase subunit A